MPSDKRGRRRSSASAPREEKNNCCTWPWILLTLIILGVAGFCIWYFVPFGDAVSDILPDFNQTTLSSGGGDDSGTKGDDGDGTTPTSEAGFNPCPSNQDDCCNGVNGLCDLGVDEVLFATTHNAHASLDEGFAFGPNHKKNLEESLRAGVRGLGMDLCSCGGQIELCHGLCGVGERDVAKVFTNIKSFLDQNPTEIVVIPIQIDNEAGDEVDLFDVYDLLVPTGVTSMMYQHPGRDTEWPTLGELKGGGKRILLFHYNSPNQCSNGQACPEGFNYYFDYATETQFEYEAVDELLDYDTSCQPRRGAGNARNFYGINNFVLPNRFPSQTAAKQVNQPVFLRNLLSNCKTRSGMDANFLIIDFWTIGGLIGVTQEHNEGLVSRRRKGRRLRL